MPLAIVTKDPMVARDADPAYIKDIERRVDRARDLVGFPETRCRTSRAEPNAPVQLALAV